MHIPRGALAAVAVAGALCLGATACSSTGTIGQSTGDQIAQQQQQQDDTTLEYAEPLPDFPFSEIRYELIQIEAIQALGISSTSFVFVQGISHPVLVCPSVGVPVPATDELSNPVTPLWKSGGSNGNYGVAGVGVDQEDPTGVYSGETSGTNGLCLNSAGQQYDVYNEAYYITITAPAYWDQSLYGGQGGIAVNGTPVMPVCHVQVLNAAKHDAEEICTKPPATSAKVKHTLRTSGYGLAS